MRAFLATDHTSRRSRLYLETLLIRGRGAGQNQLA